eukprot:TRINITY_DN406_c0_g1_i1.p4 TRINITY_DN406_c0_g1~~TRINITY_DN406_c0_g1_i1.p4  ORF type:complete len:118 (-),score=22.17 TRINITY_DN406_c0_g1_i1:226-579(-)
MGTNLAAEVEIRAAGAPFASTKSVEAANPRVGHNKVAAGWSQLHKIRQTLGHLEVVGGEDQRVAAAAGHEAERNCTGHAAPAGTTPGSVRNAALPSCLVTEFIDDTGEDVKLTAAAL